MIFIENISLLHKYLRDAYVLYVCPAEGMFCEHVGYTCAVLLNVHFLGTLLIIGLIDFLKKKVNVLEIIR